MQFMPYLWWLQKLGQGQIDILLVVYLLIMLHLLIMLQNTWCSTWSEYLMVWYATHIKAFMSKVAYHCLCDPKSRSRGYIYWWLDLKPAICTGLVALRPPLLVADTLPKICCHCTYLVNWRQQNHPIGYLITLLFLTRWNFCSKWLLTGRFIIVQDESHTKPLLFIYQVVPPGFITYSHVLHYAHMQVGCNLYLLPGGTICNTYPQRCRNLNHAATYSHTYIWIIFLFLYE